MPDRKIADQTNVPLKRTVLLASDSSNSVIAEITDGTINTIGYSAYGDQSAQQAVATRLGFNGQLHETTIGWYLLGNGYRAYNPRLMRFHSPDNWSPFGRGGLNPYMYCVGDPVNNSDPSGHSIWAVSRLVTRLTDYFEAVATRIIGTAANTLNKSVSHVGKSAKKAFSDHLLFDPNELKNSAHHLRGLNRNHPPIMYTLPIDTRSCLRRKAYLQPYPTERAQLLHRAPILPEPHSLINLLSA
jgi:RHS repeat-associated protein